MKSVSIRFPEPLYDLVKFAGAREYRSINDEVLFLVNQGLARYFQDVHGLGSEEYNHLRNGTRDLHYFLDIGTVDQESESTQSD